MYICQFFRYSDICKEYGATYRYISNTNPITRRDTLYTCTAFRVESAIIYNI